MSEQATDNLKAILERLDRGISVKLQPTAFCRLFGVGPEARKAAGQFGDDNGCLSIILEDGNDQSVEFMRKL